MYGIVLFTNKLFVYSSLLVLFLSIEVTAMAEVTSHICPYSCKMLGIPKKVCKEWRNGNMCYVNDLRKNRKKVAHISSPKNKSVKKVKPIPLEWQKLRK